jgi:zinc transporter ZupT
MEAITPHESNESNEGEGMTKLPKIVAIINIAAGALMIVLGVASYYVVHRELADEHITVSEDADNLAGKSVEGPFTAYSQAMVIKEHALDIGGGKTYAQLPQDDPTRDTVMTASFLRASLFTSVVAFGVAALVAALGLLFVLLGLAMLGILKRLPAMELASTGPPLVASVPPPEEELAPQGLA